jgi:hypothetical protein
VNSKQSLMKKLLLSIVVAVSAVFLLPQSAEARGCNSSHNYTYVSGHSSCGCAIYTKRVVRYYDCHGRPVYAYYRQPVTHRCHQNHRGHGHTSYSSNYRSYRPSSSIQFSYVSPQRSSRYTTSRRYRSSYTRCR